MTDIENWKDIPGYEGRYQVSDLGRVKSLSTMQRYLLRNGVEAFRRVRERILAQNLQNSGYLIVHLYTCNEREVRLVHRLVAEAFIAGHAANVNHKDGYKFNNSKGNLEWLSVSDNHKHAYATGLRGRNRAFH